MARIYQVSGFLCEDKWRECTRGSTTMASYVQCGCRRQLILHRSLQNLRKIKNGKRSTASRENSVCVQFWTHSINFRHYHVHVTSCRGVMASVMRSLSPCSSWIQLHEASTHYFQTTALVAATSKRQQQASDKNKQATTSNNI